MVGYVLHYSAEKFKTFRLSCAGEQSKEVSEIKKYIKDVYELSENILADLDIYIGKSNVWEVGVRVSKRPLTLRDYKEENIKGGMNASIAYAMNSFCDLLRSRTYLNIFSGSGTLLVEAGIENQKLKLVGFDIDGKTNALAAKNIKNAGLIKNIKLVKADIFQNPDLGNFDVIASDLPFGMHILKGENLEKLDILEIAHFYEKSEGGYLVQYDVEKIGDENYRIKFDGEVYIVRGPDWKDQLSLLKTIRTIPVISLFLSSPTSSSHYRELVKEFG
jgi:tRNA G10  N-methylase Trm11